MYRRCVEVAAVGVTSPLNLIATLPVPDANGPEPRKLTKGERRREEIIDVALRLFATQGYNATGLQAIADEVGITHAGVLHHFGTKLGLLKAVVYERDAFASAFERWFSGRSGLDPIVHLDEFADIIIERPLVIQLISTLVAENLDSKSPLHDYFIDRDQRVREIITDRIVEAQNSGVARTEIDAALTARGLLAFVIGANAQWLVDRDDETLRLLYEGFSRHLLERLLV